jgi:hypothetical protein
LDNIHLDPGMMNLVPTKCLCIIQINMLNIAVVDTLLYCNSNNTKLVGVKNDTHGYQMVLKCLDYYFKT